MKIWFNFGYPKNNNHNKTMIFEKKLISHKNKQLNLHFKNVNKEENLVKKNHKRLKKMPRTI